MTVQRTLKLGTRGSQLARTQSESVARSLEALHPGLTVRLEIIRTTGDRVSEIALSRIGDKGLFTKEIEDALLDRRIDLAVHSMKDMPTRLPDGLCIAAVPSRLPPYDCLVALHARGLEKVPQGARVASGSLRRRAQLLHARPDLLLQEIRGNVGTRVRKLVENDMDATVLAAAGLARLGVPLYGDDSLTAEGTALEFIVPPAWNTHVPEGTVLQISLLPPEVCLPAVGQGALCIEARIDDGNVLALLQRLDDARSRAAVTCERSLMRVLEGGCQVPIAALAHVSNGSQLSLQAAVASLDGRHLVRADGCGPADNAEAIGRDTAQRLRENGGGAILDDIRQRSNA